VSDLVTVRCSCGHAMQAQAQHLGQQGLCPACGAQFLLWPEGEGPSRTSRATWYLKVSGRQLGPFEPMAVRKFVNLGRIQPDTLVRKGEQGRWVAARKVRGLLDGPTPATAPGRPEPEVTTRRTTDPHGPGPKAPPSTWLEDAPPTARSVRHAPTRPPRSARGHVADRLARQPGLVLAIGLGLVGIVVLVVLLAKKGADEPAEPDTAETRSASPGTTPVKSTRRKKPEVLTTQQIVARASPSVAIVMGRNSSGTGFLVARDVMATNRHVIEGELLRHVTVQFPDAEKHLRGTYGVHLLYEDPDLDLAFLSVSIDLPALPLARNHEFVRGEEIIVIGSPGVGNGQILANAISRGILSTKAEIEGHTYYQLDVAINPGNSGGPVFDKHGHVVGVITLKANDRDGLGFCLPLSSLKSALRRSKRVSPLDLQVLRSMHKLRVTAAAVLRSSQAYAFAGSLYVTAMERSMAEGEDLNVGLTAARLAVSSHLRRLDGRLLAELRTCAPDVVSDTALPGDSRKRFEALWDIYNRLKEHVTNPSGTFESFKQKCENLRMARNNIALELAAQDGVDLELR